MSALTDPDSLELVDPAKEGDVTDDPEWRKLLGLDEED